MRQKENLEDWYLKINPKGLVPAIVNNGEVVTESNDIMLNLEEKYSEPRLIPSSETLAEDVKHWVNLASEIHLNTIKTYVYGTTGGGTKDKSDMERYRKIQPDKKLLAFHEQSLKGFPDSQIEEAVKQINKIFTQIDNRLANHRWIVGNEFSLADIAWMPQYVLLCGLGFPFNKYKNVEKWAKEFEKRDSYKKGIKKWMPAVPLWILRIFLKSRKLFSN